MSAGLALGVSLAGGAGAVLRFVLDGVLSTRWRAPFPYAILLINVSGSLLLGVLTGLALVQASPSVDTVLGAGFCGGFTTFSTVSYASVRLAREGRRGLGALNAIATLVLCVAAAAAGLALARA